MTQPMKGDRDLAQKDFQTAMSDIHGVVWTWAEDCQSDTHALLSLLRTLEQLHREIRVQLFEPSLPVTRKELYQLLRDIEEGGGWPYIERMKLQSLLDHWQSTAVMEEESADLADRPEESSNQDKIGME